MAFKNFDEVNPPQVSVVTRRNKYDYEKPLVRFSVGHFNKSGQVTTIYMSDPVRRGARFELGDRLEFQVDIENGLGMLNRAESNGYSLHRPSGERPVIQIQIRRTNVAKQFRPASEVDLEPNILERGAVIFKLPKSYVNDLRNHESRAA